MVAIKIENFGGEIPATDDRLLPPNAAADAINTWLYSGRVEPFHSETLLHTPVDPNARSWFRLPIGSPDIDNMVDSYWLEFENQDVRVIRSPVAQQDDDGRYYWADGIYPKYMTGTMIAAAATPYQLGIPNPTAAPTVVVSGGSSSTNKTVAYIYTWVSALGEEGPPSPPTTVTGKIDALYALTLTAPTSSDTANRNLATTRIYRTVVGTQGVATYFFVAEIPIATLTYHDDASVDTDAVVTANEQLSSLNYFGPPVDLLGMVSMPNGMIAGWRLGGEVWFCEPYQAHAWPVQYVIAVPNEIVGLGVYGQSLIILTEGQPYAATGVDPSSMALSEIFPLEPCTSRNSIVSTPIGVIYSSPNGLINATPFGAMNITLKTIGKDQWNELQHISSIAASIVALGYFCASISQAGVFQDSVTPPDALNAFQQDTFQQMSTYGTQPGSYIKLDDPRIGVSVLDPTPSEVNNIITDLFNGETMIMRDGKIYLLDLRSQEPFVTYRWRSKVFAMDYLLNFAAAKVYWTPAADSSAPPSVFRVYAGSFADMTADGLPLRFEQQLTTPGQMYRLPSGYKALYWQFEIEGSDIINSIHAATSARELREV